MRRLSAEDTERAFGALATELARRDVRAEVFVVGGAVMSCSQDADGDEGRRFVFPPGAGGA